MRLIRTALLGMVTVAMLSACQDNAPPQFGSAVMFVSGFIHTLKGQQPVAIRLDRQACFSPIRLNFRDASGLGVLVMEFPRRGWSVRTYTLSPSLGGTRGYLNISGVAASYPAARGTTVITRADSLSIEGEIDWTLGEPLFEGGSDTTRSYLRAVGRFSAAPGCVM